MKNITPFGKFIRKLCIDKSLRLYDIAKIMKIGPAELSSMTLGKIGIEPWQLRLLEIEYEWVSLLSDEYTLLNHAAAENNEIARIYITYFKESDTVHRCFHSQVESKI